MSRENVDPADQLIVDQFHQLYYGSQEWDRMTWLGVRTLKCPLDLWIYQEILYETRPEWIIECGTFKGGSALYLATVLDQIGRGMILTIDCNDTHTDRPKHRRIEYLCGLSTETATVERVRREVATCGEPGKLLWQDPPVMVILDSDHSKAHVLRELEAYAPMVTPGQYLIVEDTNINGRPVSAGAGPGPAEAVEEFLISEIGKGLGFEVDQAREKFFMSFNPGGYLRRVMTR